MASSGNVFRDLGLKDAEEKKTKVRLAVAINDILDRANLRQARRRAAGHQPAQDFGAQELSS